MPTSLITMHGNVLASVDVETTGREPWLHEIVQVAVVPLDCHVKPVGTPFYRNIRPTPGIMSPEAMKTHGLSEEILSIESDAYTVGEDLWAWFESLRLPPGKKLIPLIHNSQFDVPFLQTWLGYELFNDIFGYPTRDTQALAAAMMDKAAYKGYRTVPFNGSASLGRVCSFLDIDLPDAHDALADAVATAAVYRTLLNRGDW